MFWHMSVCLSTTRGVLWPGPDGGGVPQPGKDWGYSITGWGMVPSSNRGQGVPHLGYPPPSRSGWEGVPPSLDRGYPGQVQTAGGTPQYRTTDEVLDMPRLVCLLCSRRRTFFFKIKFKTEILGKRLVASLPPKTIAKLNLIYDNIYIISNLNRTETNKLINQIFRL